MRNKLSRLVLAATIAALVASALPAQGRTTIAASAARKSSGSKPDAGAPFDYTSIKGLSKAKYETVRETAEVEAEDGIKLHVEVVRPKNPGRYGVLLELSPYHGTLANRQGTRILPGPRDENGDLIGVTGYFAPRGYAVVMADLRGTGKSEGCLDHLGANDQSDTKVLVEWAAKQKWSNGRVGMLGHSYVGSTPSMAAAMRPKGLATIVPSAGLAAMYHHEFQDGVPYFLQWAGPLFAYEALAIGRHLPPLQNVPPFGDTGDNFGNDMQYFGCGAPNSAAVTGEAYFSGAYTDWHAERDWRRGATKAKIPVFMIHGVKDDAARIAAIDWFNARRNPRDKVWIGQWDHGGGSPHRPNSRTCGDDISGPCVDDEYTAALHAWFDKWLLGRKVLTGPPVEIFLNNGKVMTSNVWPPRTKTMRLYPAADAKLLPKAGDDGSASYVADARGFSNELNTGHVEFRSAPFKKDTAIVGVPKLRLIASVAGVTRVHINATLYDAEGDTLKRIGRAGWAIQPELRNGIDNPEPVIPLEEMTMNLDAQSQAHVLAKGHRLVLRVASSHPDKVPTFANGTQVTVHFGGEKGTAMSLPVVVKPKLYNDVFGPLGRHMP